MKRHRDKKGDSWKQAFYYLQDDIMHDGNPTVTMDEFLDNLFKTTVEEYFRPKQKQERTNQLVDIANICSPVMVPNRGSESMDEFEQELAK